MEATKEPISVQRHDAELLDGGKPEQTSRLGLRCSAVVCACARAGVCVCVCVCVCVWFRIAERLAAGAGRHLSPRAAGLDAHAVWHRERTQPDRFQALPVL